MGKQDRMHGNLSRVRVARVCHYAEGLLIGSSSSGGVGGRIIRHLPFLFFQNSFIFRFFSKENSIFPFYNSPASSSFRFCRPVYRYSLTYWLISSIKQTMSSLHNRDWPKELNITLKWVRLLRVGCKCCCNYELRHAN